MSLEKDETWMKCTDWLARCGMISQQQKNTFTALEQLASILKDGVVLCNLLNFIKPGCISIHDFCPKPQTTYFLCQKNIKVFLKTCKTSFGFKERNLFNPNELFSPRDFKNVIHTLSLLSHCKELERENIEPFEADSEAEYVVMQNLLDECGDEYSSSLYDFQIDNETREQEEIYDSLISMQPQRVPYEAIQLSEEKAKKPRCAKPVKELCYTTKIEQSTKTKKEYVIEEICDTEKKFICVLEQLTEFFMEPLKPYIIDDHHTIFYKIEELKDAHTNFFNSLQKVKESENEVIAISACFLKAKRSFYVYGEYFCGQNLAQERLHKVMKTNPMARNIIEDSDSKVKLQDLILIPSQRILKYHLLIRALLKSCRDNQEETAEAKKALEAMEDLGVYLNEVKRDNETSKNIFEIQSNICDIENYFSKCQKKLESYGRLHFDGCYKIKGARVNKYENRYLLVFDRLLLICKPYQKIIKKIANMFNGFQFDQYYLIGSIAMINCNVETNEGKVLVTDSSNNAVFYNISSDRKEAISKLIECLRIARDNITAPGKNSDIYLTNFRSPTECSMCHNLLRGLLCPGYYNKKQNKSYHKECLPKASKARENHAGKQDTDKFSAQASFGSTNHFKHMDYKWVFSGNKHEASSILRCSPYGTFLVRWSEANESYAISLKVDKIRHMLVQQEASDFFLNRDRCFKNIPQLVKYYETNSLVEAFRAIDSCLLMPYSEVESEKCVALYDFSATDARQLTFSEGDVIEIVSKGSGGGWWRGRLDGKRGTFPSNYVEVLD